MEIDAKILTKILANQSNNIPKRYDTPWASRIYSRIIKLLHQGAKVVQYSKNGVIHYINKTKDKKHMINHNRYHKNIWQN